jgi:short-subunit dehydrogenase
VTDRRQVALITGGSSGIGAACVRKFLAQGWRVSTVALPDPDLYHLSKFDVLVIPGDITSTKVRERAVETTYERYTRVDALINNAGVGIYAFATEVSSAMLSRVLDVNVIAPLALAQMTIPRMRKQEGGTIVNIGSVAGFVALPWAAAYSASKFALNAMHDCLRRELRGSCINLVKVCPGIVDTEFRNHVLAGAVPPRIKSIRWIVSAETVADRIFSAIEHRRRTVFVPRIGRLFALGDIVARPLMDVYLSQFVSTRPFANRIGESCKHDADGIGISETLTTAADE